MGNLYLQFKKKTFFFSNLEKAKENGEIPPGQLVGHLDGGQHVLSCPGGS